MFFQQTQNIIINLQAENKVHTQKKQPKIDISTAYLWEINSPFTLSGSILIHINYIDAFLFFILNAKLFFC